MADEKLPEYVEKVVADACLAIMSKDTEPFSAADVALSVRARLREMIHRFAREREAAAMERAANEVAVSVKSMSENFAASMNDEWLTVRDELEHCERAIRALIHKEPANG